MPEPLAGPARVGILISRNHCWAINLQRRPIRNNCRMERNLSINLNRRSFIRQGSSLLAAAHADSLLRDARAAGSVPVGLALSSVDDELAKDKQGTLRAVAQMGYQAVDFF